MFDSLLQIAILYYYFKTIKFLSRHFISIALSLSKIPYKFYFINLNPSNAEISINLIGLHNAMYIEISSIPNLQVIYVY